MEGCLDIIKTVFALIILIAIIIPFLSALS
jgi:hypothetical protein